MPVNQAFLSEFDQEMQSTRKALERIPEDKFAWKPHPKSGTMIWLAGHVASIPGWVKETVQKDSLDIAPDGKPMEPPPPPKSRKELIDLFEKNVAAGRAALAGASDDAHWLKPWTLLSNGQTLLTMPRVGVMRSFVMNHLIHHRAQLIVYLRLNNVPVPGMYGPSADEPSF
jgi:uncharacterized damage-inducible protein DinB